MMVEFVRRADLLDPSAIHDDHAVGQRHRLDLVVGDVDCRGLDLLMHALDLGAHLHAQLGVEIGQRFVEQENLGIAHDGAAHGDALALSARKCLGAAGKKLGDVENAGGVVDAAV